MKKNFNIQIVCVLSDTLWLGLSGIRVNYGHDDSLPYQADMFIMDKDNNPNGSTAFKKIGIVWNDGWGGDSNIEPALLKGSDEYIQKANELCKQHKEYYNGEPFGEYDLGSLCDYMASLWVDIDGDKKYKNQTLLYRFDDDPVTIANKGANLYRFK